MFVYVDLLRIDCVLILLLKKIEHNTVAKNVFCILVCSFKKLNWSELDEPKKKNQSEYCDCR
jgi:hypothetical protein